MDVSNYWYTGHIIVNHELPFKQLIIGRELYLIFGRIRQHIRSTAAGQMKDDLTVVQLRNNLSTTKCALTESEWKIRKMTLNLALHLNHFR